jgi:hypothetical protein
MPQERFLTKEKYIQKSAIQSSWEGEKMKWVLQEVLQGLRR